MTEQGKAPRSINSVNIYSNLQGSMKGWHLQALISPELIAICSNKL